jgi:NAD(P)-dependent dehydrogenase (short-subunit alcohol dehydrogenase family)
LPLLSYALWVLWDNRNQIQRRGSHPANGLDQLHLEVKAGGKPCQFFVDLPITKKITIELKIIYLPNRKSVRKKTRLSERSISEDTAMTYDLKNKIAVVTGSGKKTGIGYGIVHKLATRGADVILADLTGKEIRQNEPAAADLNEMTTLAGHLEKKFKIKAFPVALDVTRGDSIAQMADQVQKQFGRIDILCNNAGAVFGVPNAIHTYDEDAWMKTIDVNLHGIFRVSKALIPLMLGSGGCIVNVASRAAKVPPLFNGAYAVAKAGVVMLTKVMAKELAGAGIRVNAICPGVIQTGFTAWRFKLEAQILDSTVAQREAEMLKTIPMGRLGAADEVADLVAFLASDQSSYITGQAINITGGQLMEI